MPHKYWIICAVSKLVTIFAPTTVATEPSAKSTLSTLSFRAFSGIYGLSLAVKSPLFSTTSLPSLIFSDNFGEMIPVTLSTESYDEKIETYSGKEKLS